MPPVAALQLSLIVRRTSTSVSTERMPQIQTSDIERIIARDFAAAEVECAAAILTGYCSDNSDSAQNRVRMAALRLAEGNIERLRHFVECANEDYRDVLAWAEYPNAMRGPAGSAPNSDERIKANQADWRQYHDWLTKP